MSYTNSLENSLLICYKCIKVLKYYDYLSHIEICNNDNNNNNNNDIEIQNVIDDNKLNKIVEWIFTY